MIAQSTVRPFLPLLVLAAPLAAGPLAPRPGPIEPVFKTLDEVQPRTPLSQSTTPGDADSVFRITEPGSYYLTAAINGSLLGKRGIEIVADNVTIDLNGFTLRGTPGSLQAISTQAQNIRGVVVRNGSIEDWDGDGIALAALHCLVEDVLVRGCEGNGIIVGVGSRIASCRVEANGLHGIDAASGCIIASCSATSNSGNGIDAAGSGNVIDSTAIGNGLNGFASADGCVFARCTAEQNVRDGFAAEDGVVISGCTSTANGGAGIVVVTGSTVRDCTASRNGGDGIRTGSNGALVSNTSVENGQATWGGGIRAAGSGNRIESNHVVGNPVGIAVAGDKNLIVRNSARANSNAYAVTGENIVAPIVHSAGELDGAHPWANFAF